jgi:hypothetical protein
VYDFLPDEQLHTDVNLSDSCGMLIFDNWTCNTNGRQAVYFRRAGETNSKALAYTAEHIRGKEPAAQFAARTNAEPSPSDRRQQFIVPPLEEQENSIVPMTHVEMFAEGLRRQLQ